MVNVISKPFSACESQPSTASCEQVLPEVIQVAANSYMIALEHFSSMEPNIGLLAQPRETTAYSHRP